MELEELQVLRKQLADATDFTTPGEWVKGETSHHNKVVKEDGSDYPIAEFHHAIDANFSATAHNAIPKVLAALEELIQLKKRQVVITKNEAGEVVCVSWQDSRGRILEVIWEREPDQKILGKAISSPNTEPVSDAAVLFNGTYVSAVELRRWPRETLEMWEQRLRAKFVEVFGFSHTDAAARESFLQENVNNPESLLALQFFAQALRRTVSEMVSEISEELNKLLP